VEQKPLRLAFLAVVPSGRSEGLSVEEFRCKTPESKSGERRMMEVIGLSLVRQIARFIGVMLGDCTDAWRDHVMFQTGRCDASTMSHN
jgi:hypothetical protein